MNGMERNDNPDDMVNKQKVGSGQTPDEDDVFDFTNSNIPVSITRDPEEAIALLFDISGSMDTQFFGEKELKRIGAVKAFFSAFADRTMAYDFHHVVSLVFFDNQFI